MRFTRRDLVGDEGTTLIELMVGILLMSVFGAMFTGAIVMMNSAVNKTQAVNLSSSQLNQAFLTLDKTVRYATAISVPGTSVAGGTGDWYVELRTTNTGSEVCTQLRVDIGSQQLQRRTWTVANGSTVAGSLTLFTTAPVASGISNGAALSGATTQPFYLRPPVTNASFQQLTLNLKSPAGSGAALTTSVSAFTFTALNSSLPVPTTPICQQQIRP